MTYRDFTIPKKSGGVRLISAPSPELKAYQQRYLSRLMKFFKYLNNQNLGNRDIIHGFVKDRNAVTMARKHIGYNTTMFFDIEDFFNNITREKISKYFPSMESKLKKEYFHHANSFEKEYLAQGFCTSPILASMYSIPIMKVLDKELSKIKVKGGKLKYVLTIYADDIVLSIKEEKNYELEQQIKKLVYKIIESFELTINKKKTRVRRQCFGARRILGINVYETTLEPTRKLKRKIRAVKHQVKLGEDKASALGGLITWSKNYLPKIKH